MGKIYINFNEMQTIKSNTEKLLTLLKEGKELKDNLFSSSSNLSNLANYKDFSSLSNDNNGENLCTKYEESISLLETTKKNLDNYIITFEELNKPIE